MSNKIILYTTLGCHLCDEAEVLITQVLPKTWSLQKVDIAERDDLLEAYGTRIPVVEIKGQQLYWPFSLVELHQAVKQAG